MEQTRRMEREFRQRDLKKNVFTLEEGVGEEGIWAGKGEERKGGKRKGKGVGFGGRQGDSET